MASDNSKKTSPIDLEKSRKIVLREIGEKEDDGKAEVAKIKSQIKKFLPVMPLKANQLAVEKAIKKEELKKPVAVPILEKEKSTIVEPLKKSVAKSDGAKNASAKILKKKPVKKIKTENKDAKKKKTDTKRPPEFSLPIKPIFDTAEAQKIKSAVKKIEEAAASAQRKRQAEVLKKRDDEKKQEAKVEKIIKDERREKFKLPNQIEIKTQKNIFFRKASYAWPVIILSLLIATYIFIDGVNSLYVH